jgi:two-component system, chemotaxis family, CheB/CheR fusion protein
MLHTHLRSRPYARDGWHMPCNFGRAMQDDFLIVGVGASAGGLEPLERLFAAVPNPCGMAFVVLQHLSPDFESRMDELLGRQTTLPIHRVTDGVEVQPNAIYLIPPRKEMIISGGKLLLNDKEDKRAFSLPIDHFFRSLAHDMGRRAVGVILSGAGSDGSRGLREIHESGGLVLCQTPETARFQSMPLAAQQTNIVDRFLNPDEIPTALIEYSRDPGRRVDDHERAAPRGAAMDEVLHLLRAQYGIDFAHYKPSTVTRRIERRVTLTNQIDLGSYARALAADPDELNALYKDLLIGVTRFFRDPEAFDCLQSKVVPSILTRVPPHEEIRVWSAACATGEEVYSLAILFHEQLEAAQRPLNVRIFATDVHRTSLDFASAGVYEEEALSDVTAARRERYFVKDGNRYRVSKELRQMVVFAQHNLISDAPFTRVDLITCRNLLIYFQPMVQRKVLSLLHFGLKTGAALLLGPSETPGELADEFDTVDGHWRLYTKRREARLPDIRLPLTVAPHDTAASRGSLSVGLLASSGRGWAGPQLMGLYDQLLDRAMPPSLLVDEHYHLVHTFGGAESLLRIKGGRASPNVLDLVDDNIKTALLGALQHAHKERATVRLAGIPVSTPNGTEEYRLTVETVGEATGQTHFLIQYENKGPTALTLAADGAKEVPEPSRDYVSALESELRFTKESLQATIEELETANEELQATNEELVASNEELQSTNEELHSVNEELYTVNVEHQRKITQLGEITDDLDNLLHSIDVGVLFLDDKLCIRKYTSQVANVFRLLPQDVGRRFDSFAPTIQHPELEADVEAVRKTGQPIVREVTSREGVIYLLHILPYRSAAQKSGVVLTLIDISALKRSEAHVRRLSSIVESSTDAITSEDLDGKVVSWNSGAEQMYGFAADEVRGRELSFLMPAEQRAEWAEVMRSVLKGESKEPYETVRVRKDGSHLDVQIAVSPLWDEHNRIIGVSSIARDITQRKRDEAEIRRAIRMRDQFMAMLSHELRNPLAALLHASAVLKDPGGKPETSQHARAVVERQCKHMARLLDDLLDVSRMRQVGIELRRQRVDLRATVEAAVERTRPLAEERGITIEVESYPEELAVFGDPDRLQQVECNLLGNAIKYSPEHKRVWLSLGREDERAIIRVKDEGNGIARDMLERIFEPFVRAVDDDSVVHQPQMGGMGLGLAVVRSFVKAHGGEVWAKSDGVGCGSELVVSLPLAAAVDAYSSTKKAFGPERLVLVEDQDDSRMLLQTILEGAGYDVVSAADGGSAIEMIERQRPGIALVDIGLPVLNGYEVARRIRRVFGPNDIFLVALTGYGQQQDREAVISAGFDQHIVKPIDAATLIEVLHTRRRLRGIDLATVGGG